MATRNSMESQSSGGRFWLRVCSLVVADASGQGLELADLRITFKTQKGDTETPNSAEIKVYNLSEATMSRMRKEFSRVALTAGYRDNAGVIFDGNIRQTRVGRENGTDSWIEITAADGDKAYNFATVSTTLAAGSTPKDRVSACGQAFAAKGAGAGHTPELPGSALPRGRVMYGMARKFMREESRNTQCSWSIRAKNPTATITMMPNGQITAEADQRITLRAPSIVLEAGSISASGYDGGATNATIKGNIDHTGNKAQTGNYTQQGSHTSSGDQVAGGVSQVNHPHQGVLPGGGQSGPPVAG